MKFGDIILSLLIIFIFLMCSLVSYLSKGFKNIQNNWPEYRCNPIIMPFAGYFGHDTEKNFSQCIGQLNKSTVAFLTADLHAGHSMLNSGLAHASDGMNGLKSFQGGFRPAIGGQFTNVFGVFQNVLVEFQKFVIGFKDMIMKILGIVATILYMLSGQNMLGNSIVKGPIVGTMNVIGDAADILSFGKL